MKMEKKKTLEFNVKGPVAVFLEEDRPDHRSGCSILDVSFAEPVSIAEIQCRNYYTAYISILCKRVPLDKDVRNRDLLPWQSAIKRLSLMPDPHCEHGSQDIVAIPSSMSIVPWSGVVAIRFILKQPSSHWRKFGIDDLVFHKDVHREQKPAVYVPRMFASGRRQVHNVSVQENQSKETGTATETGTVLQNLKNVTELMKTMHTAATVGRFEVDGSYDVSHLI